jgi:anti-sigma regulatory factor (Ser/Thr protein kinase)
MTVLRAMVEKVAQLAGFDDEEVGHIVLAVDEACTNIIRHQYEGRCDERIDIEVRSDEAAGRLELVLRDYGPVRDPSLFRGRPLEEVRPGGLGLHLIQKIMDEIEYSPAPGGGMKLRLAKTVGASGDLTGAPAKKDHERKG